MAHKRPNGATNSTNDNKSSNQHTDITNKTSNPDANKGSDEVSNRSNPFADNGADEKAFVHTHSISDDAISNKFANKRSDETSHAVPDNDANKRTHTGSIEIANVSAHIHASDQSTCTSTYHAHTNKSTNTDTHV
jgi:hypothetical protein